MKSIYILVFAILLGGCATLSHEASVTERNTCFIHTDFINHRYELSMMVKKEYLVSTDPNKSMGSDVLTIPPIHLIKGEPFEWKLVNKDDQSGVVVRGIMKENRPGECDVTCTLSILEKGKMIGFKDQTFSTSVRHQIPLIVINVLSDARTLPPSTIKERIKK